MGREKGTGGGQGREQAWQGRGEMPPPETSPSPVRVWDEWLSRSLEALSSRALLRTLRPIQVASAARGAGGGSSPLEARPPSSRSNSLEPAGRALADSVLLDAGPGADKAQCAPPSHPPARLESPECGASLDTCHASHGPWNAFPPLQHPPSLEVPSCDADAVRVVVPPLVFQHWLQEHQEPARQTDGTPGGAHPGQLSECSVSATAGAPGAGPQAGLDPQGTPGVALTLFSGNDYLGLSSHLHVRRAAAQAAMDYGMGPRASALVCGYTEQHRMLEQDLARLKHTEDCLLCPTGFAANMATLISLLPLPTPKGPCPSPLAPTTPKPWQQSPGAGPTTSGRAEGVPEFRASGSEQGFEGQGRSRGPLRDWEGGEESVAVFSDELNHASIIDGVRLLVSSSSGGRRRPQAPQGPLGSQESAMSKGATESEGSQRATGPPGVDPVRLHVYRHSDMAHLEELLRASPSRRKVVVTDSLFSMDGDFARLKDLAALRKRYGFLLILDEAHATLVCGPKGGGAAEQMGVEANVDIHVGTLSKAVGAMGGFVACSSQWKSLIMSRGRSFIFSTALPLPTVAAARAALEVAAREPARREAVWRHVEVLSSTLGTRFDSPICPILIGGAQEALAASRELLLAGFHVPAIRPPTVPENSCRLRVALSSAHSREQVLALASALDAIVKRKPFVPYPPPRTETGQGGVDAQHQVVSRL